MILVLVRESSQRLNSVGKGFVVHLCFFFQTVFTCQYQRCEYRSWGSWSKTCGDVTRSRTLSRGVWTSVRQYGGCAGYSTTCKQTETETKTLSKCPSM